MRRIWLLFLLIPGLLPLGGCVAGMAASAVGMAAQGTRKPPVAVAESRADVIKACSDHAAQFGAVHIIDVEQPAPSRIIVWGTVGDGRQKRSFRCAYGTKILSFRLRAIKPTV